MVDAPADTPLCHRGCALVGHLATTLGTGGGDLCDRSCGYRRQAFCGMEFQLLTVRCAFLVDGVGPCVVGLVRCKIRHGHLESTQFGFRCIGMATVRRRVVVSAPTHAAPSECQPAIGGHVTRACSRSGGHVDDFHGRHRRLQGLAACTELQHFAETGARGVDGVGAHIIGSRHLKVLNTNGILPGAAVVIPKGIVRQVRIVAVFAPADAALGHVRAAVGLHFALHTKLAILGHHFQRLHRWRLALRGEVANVGQIVVLCAIVHLVAVIVLGARAQAGDVH